MKERMSKKLGPPSPEEINAIRAENKKLVRTKMAPLLMGNLEDLAQKRMAEILTDKKVLVRVLGDKISADVLVPEQAKQLDKRLTDAGYPPALVSGGDAVLDSRMEQMVHNTVNTVLGTPKEKKSIPEKYKKK